MTYEPPLSCRSTALSRYEALGTEGRPHQSRAATSGFMPRDWIWHRVYNFAIAFLLILLALPALILISVMLLATQGTGILYRGERIGRNGRPFHILKFRTLDDRKAADLTRDRVLPSDSGIETPMGRFLRECRLDELPQLFNVLLGDMNICGPRPVRPEIAEVGRRTIPGYEKRFLVKPGLIGPTQAFMSHDTSKRIRARYNAVLCSAPVRYRCELGMVMLVGACVLTHTLSQLFDHLRRRPQGPVGPDLALAAGVRVTLVCEDQEETPVESIGESMMLVDPPLRRLSRGRLVLSLPDGRRRSAAIDLEPAVARTSSLFHYRPANDVAQYTLSRYLARRVVVPHRSQRFGAGLHHFLRGRAAGPSRPLDAREAASPSAG